MTVTAGTLRKMIHAIDSDGLVSYHLNIDGQKALDLNGLIGKTICLRFEQSIECIHCGRAIKKTFNNGYCYPCVQSLAQCDICIVKPELCHFDKGTCREPDWGEKNCLIDHTVYLANTSGIKVGITRKFQQLTRWIDQGATQAIPLVTVASRKQAGLLEVELAKNLADKTNWRTMLKGASEKLDLERLRSATIDKIAGRHEFVASQDPALEITYPVERYPEKIHSYNLDKTPEITDTLVGIKGQYLIFANGVINCRKWQGYKVSFSHAAN